MEQNKKEEQLMDMEQFTGEVLEQWVKIHKERKPLPIVIERFLQGMHKNYVNYSLNGKSCKSCGKEFIPSEEELGHAELCPTCHFVSLPE